MKILIACFPKSGSTFLSSVIANLPGFSLCEYTPAYGRREQEPVELDILRCSDRLRHVVQLHVKPSDYVLSLFEKYDVTPVVLVRNIYDCLVSLADHLRSESPVLPMAYFDEKIAGLPFDQRLLAVVDLAAPWYINFYVSWFKTMPNAICTYEGVILGETDSLLNYLWSVGIDVDKRDLESAVRAARSRSTRFNVGTTGRGRVIPEASMKRISELCAHYTDIDFRPIGLS